MNQRYNVVFKENSNSEMICCFDDNKFEYK